MKTWKITNIHNAPVRIVISMSSTASVGVKLQPNHFVLSRDKQTPTIDAQNRRKLISIDKEFDNSELQLPMRRAFHVDEIDKKKKELAAAKATEYVEK